MVTCRGNKLQTSINFVVEETSYAVPPLWLYAKSPTPFLYIPTVSFHRVTAVHYIFVVNYSAILLHSCRMFILPKLSLLSPYTFAKRVLVLARFTRLLASSRVVSMQSLKFRQA